MAFKFVAFLAMLALANAGHLSSAQVYHAAPATVVKSIAAPDAHIYHAAPEAHVYHASPEAHVYHSGQETHVYHAAPAAAIKTVAPLTHYAAQHVLAKADDEFDAHPQYKYGYHVEDAASGDSKSQVEERDGDAVRGEYSLIDADGYKRTVKYTADDHSGFNAVVEREPHSSFVKNYAPATNHAAPEVVKTVAPVSHYAAPFKTVGPVAHYAAPAYSTFSAPAHYVSHH